MRPVFLRPGLMYHPHTRPASTLPAAILEASAALHRSPPLPLPIPTPAQLIARLGAGSSPSQSVARLLTTPPLHVDTVAKAVCAAIEEPSVFGAVDVYGIRKLAGWKDDASLHGSVYGQSVAGATSGSGGAGRSWPSQQQQPLQAASRPTAPHGVRHTAAATPAGQHRAHSTGPRLPTPPPTRMERRTFFSLPDLGKLASSALSSAAPGASGKGSRSYRDAQGRTVYETSKVLAHPAHTLFAVVADVNAYKQFVPYCQDSRVLGPVPRSQSDQLPPAVLADLTVGFGRFSETYTSQVTMYSPSSSGDGSSSVVAEAVQPNPVFSFLSTNWTFHPIEGGQTRVEFSLVYAFRNPVYGAVAGNVFEQMSAQMIGAFEERANKLHPLQRRD